MEPWVDRAIGFLAALLVAVLTVLVAETAEEKPCRAAFALADSAADSLAVVRADASCSRYFNDRGTP